MAEVWDKSTHAGTHLLMLLAIADFADDEGRAYPSVASLARKCRMTSRNVNLILAGLRESGELQAKINEGPRGTNMYRIPTLKDSSPLKNPSPLKPASPTPEAGFPLPLKPASDEPSVNHQRTTSASSASADPLSCPAEKIIDAYHRRMPDNPKCKLLSTARRGSIKARWNEAAKLTCKPFGYSTTPDGIAAWEAFFTVCADSLFLTGRATPQPGRPPFVADLDFLMSPKGFAGCLENKYHREVAP